MSVLALLVRTKKTIRKAGINALCMYNSGNSRDAIPGAIPGTQYLIPEIPV